MDMTSGETGNANWKRLYKIGGIAPLVALAFYLSQFLILLSRERYPDSVEGWFTLFQRNKLLGLYFLNALDIFSIAILGLMFLAICIALMETNPAYMAVAAFFAFLGIAVFVSARASMVSGTLTLSHQYAAAETEMQRSRILAAGQAIMALSRATPETIGYLFMAVAGLIMSAVILQGRVFSKATAVVGILASVATFANDLSVVVAPALAATLMPINGALWLVWWLLISRGLFRLSGASSEV